MKIALCCRSVSKINFLMDSLNRYTLSEPLCTLEVEVFSELDKIASRHSGFDLIFVDTSTNNFHDFLIAHDIQKEFPATAFIFVSNNPKLTLSFKGLDSCFHYAYTMPYSAFEQLLSQVKLNQQSYAITYQYHTVTLPIRQITHIESQGRLLLFHRYNSDQPPSKKYGRLKDMEREFSPYSFIRCHNSFIVNPTYILRLDTHHVELALDDKFTHSPSIIPMGKNFREQVHSSYVSYQKSHSLHFA